MDKHTNDLQLICSLATWRILRKHKKTQSDIIAIFCKDIIKKKYETTIFDTEHLQQELQNVYGFDLPNSVIAEVLTKNLSQILQRNVGGYKLTKKIENNNEMNVLIGHYQKEYNEFSKNLQDFVRRKSQNRQPQEILELFNQYILLHKDEILDKTKDQQFFAYFAEFLLNHKDKYTNLLQTIKEGVILYEGLRYRVDKTKNHNKLVLFLDTEIIFSAMGYNGELYKKKFDEFYDLARKYDGCKKDENMLRMPLYYDEAVETEIRHNFDYARKIRKKGTANYKPTAVLRYLTDKNNFKDESNIDIEESRFFYHLNTKLKITKYNKLNENYENLLNQYKDFNLESLRVIENIKQEYRDKQKHCTDEEVQDSIRALNLISLIRHSYPKIFFEAQALLITNTVLTNKIAWHKDIMENKNIPLATTLDFITARLWELLSESLGNGLETINPIFNIQVLLKKIHNNNLMIEYAETLEIYEQNKDDGFLKQALLDIQEKTKLEPNKDNIEFFEIMLSDEKLAEEKKLQSLEKDKQHRLGIEKGKEIGIKEGIELGIQQERERIAKEKEQADREAKRQDKKLNKNKRYIKCNVFIIWKKIKKYYKVIIGSSLVLFILALIGAFGGLPFIINWLKGF